MGENINNSKVDPANLKNDLNYFENPQSSQYKNLGNLPATGISIGRGGFVQAGHPMNSNVMKFEQI